MSLFQALLFLHVVAVLMLAVGDVGALAATIRARRFESPRTVLTLMQYHRAIIRAQLVPGAMGSLATGLLLVWQLHLAVTQTWLVGTLVAWAASLALGLGLLLPDEARAIRAAQRLVDAGSAECDAELRAAVGGVRVVVAEWTTVVLLLAMTWFMIAKPA